MRVRLFFALGFMFTITSVFAQNWSLMNPAYKYNYAIKDSVLITHTVWVDSLEMTTDGDTIYYLNRIVNELDSGLFWDEMPNYIQFNQAHFLQEKVTKSDSGYTFSMPSTYHIIPHSEPGANWLFCVGITANLLEKTEELIFGELDSVKTIVLNTNDTLKISKKYGILRFDMFTDNITYNFTLIRKFSQFRIKSLVSL